MAEAALITSIAVSGELDETPEPELRRQLQRQVVKHRPRVVPSSRQAERVFEDLLARGVGTPYEEARNGSSNGRKRKRE